MEKKYDWKNWDNSGFYRLGIEESIKKTLENSDPMPEIKPRLTERMEIAFYNVIDHRCDKAEEINAPAESICKNITDYTERFIANHEMSKAKAKELRDFTACIVRLYRTYPIG